MMGVTSIRLNPEIEKPLKNLTQKLDRSKNYLINQAVTEFVMRQEMEQDRWQDTLEALQGVKNSRFIDGNIVDKWLDSWGSDDETQPPNA